MKIQSIISANTSLSGHRLTLARLGTIGLAALTLAAFLSVLPAYLIYLHMVCVGTARPVGQLTSQAVQALQAVGLSAKQTLRRTDIMY